MLIFVSCLVIVPANPPGTLREAALMGVYASCTLREAALRASTWGKPRQVLQRLVPPQHTASPRPHWLTTNKEQIRCLLFGLPTTNNYH
ncbi:hypothetical protein [Fischerella sp. PCC 9605]|uniref:hypothetical protein n=1 Tax=Fischerella sp. PCC 9605 TaxID=1173024 RepID=UPI0012DF2C2C|nr:hypothetical protein [Fischerella sp. PCC 9605]